MEKILISRREAASLLSVSLRTIDGLLARGELKARKLGRRTLIPRAELERFARHGAAREAGNGRHAS